MAPDLDSVSDVSDAKKTWSLIVRVIRLWYVVDVKNNVKTNKLPLSMDLVLMDAKGDRIHATVRRSLIYKFEGELKEGSVYSMFGLGVADVVGAYRTTRHPCKLAFEYGTKVMFASNDAVPANVFSLTPVQEVFQKDYDTDYLVDVMGMLITIGKEHHYERNGSWEKLVDLYLNADGFHFTCTLFGRYVDELNSFVASQW